MTLIRLNLADLEQRAAARQPGYVAAVKAAAEPDRPDLSYPSDAQHLVIAADKLNELRAAFAWPGDDLTSRAACCGG